MKEEEIMKKTTVSFSPTVSFFHFREIFRFRFENFIP